MIDTQPKGFTESKSDVSEAVKFDIGTPVELTRPCMLPAIPVGAKGKIVAFEGQGIELLLLERGLWFKVAFDLTPYNLTVNTPDGEKPVGGLTVYVGTDQMRPYDPAKHLDYVVMCVGDPLSEHTYAYYRPDDYSDLSWHYVISFGKDRTIYHYFKDSLEEVYISQFGKDMVEGSAVLVPALPNQSLSPFHK